MWTVVCDQLFFTKMVQNSDKQQDNWLKQALWMTSGTTLTCLRKPASKKEDKNSS